MSISQIFFGLIAKFARVVCPKFPCNKIASLHASSHCRDFEIKQRSRAQLAWVIPLLFHQLIGVPYTYKLSQMALTWVKIYVFTRFFWNCSLSTRIILLANFQWKYWAPKQLNCYFHLCSWIASASSRHPPLPQNYPVLDSQPITSIMVLANAETHVCSTFYVRIISL